jgi:pimeloyl-ACP methyl ester carboxylesterase
LTASGSTSNGPVECWANIGELRLRYLDWGGDGPPVVALHGLASSANWYDIVAPLLRDHYRIVAPDQRGHGQTTQAPTGYDWETLSADVARFMDHLGMDKASVLGHSWGGNVATNFAARHSDRVNRVVMIDGGFLGGQNSRDTNWEEFSQRVRPRDVSGTRVEFLDRLRVQLADCWSDTLEHIVQTMVYEDNEGQIRDILHPDNHAQVIRAMWDQPPSTVLPNISCPAMIVAAGPRPDRAASDFSIRREEMVAAASKDLKDGQVHWIPNTIHDIGYHKPVELADLIKSFIPQG